MGLVVDIKKTLLIGLGLLLPALLCADETPQTQVIGPFGGLNTNISQEALPASASPDLLNVDITQGGRSVKKRQGFGLDVSLSFSSSTAHNLYIFFDASGNQVRLAFNDRNVNASVNGASWSVILTTGITTGATWDCTDYLGFAYCVSSAFDCPIKTNGTVAGTTGVCGTNAAPQGSLVASTGDRLLIGATSANPSRIYYSASASFSDFSLGTQNSSSSFEDINAPGSKLTHLAYHYGRWLWWKDSSFGFIIGTGQLDLQIVTVSNTVGTLDNTDVYDQGLTYFRGNDAQFYVYDGANLTRTFSVDISPTLRSANKRKSNSWSQSSQSDFASGSIVPTNNLSTAISPGDVIVSSFLVTENSSSSWTLGYSSNTTIWASSITISTNNVGNITNPDFESSFSGNWTGSGNAGEQLTRKTSASWPCGTLSAQSGSAFAESEGGGTLNWTGKFGAYDKDGATSSDRNVSLTAGLNDCAWHQITLTPSASDVGKRMSFKFSQNSGVTPGFTGLTATSDSYIWGGPISFYYTTAVSGSNEFVAIDNITLGSSTISSGAFTSQVYNTGFTSSTFQISAFNETANTPTPTFSIQTSSTSTGPWSTLVTSSGTNAVGNQYVRWVSTISVGASDNANTYISSITIISRSTGTYYSPVNNAPLLSSWNEFTATDNSNGGTIAYFTRSSTNNFTVLSSTPSWVSQTKNGTVVVSTGTYMQMRADFSLTAATHTPTLSDFQFNWFEGSASDKMYATYFNNAVWFSVSLGTAATSNNRVLRYDLLSQVWTLYNIPANGFLTYNNFLYFAGASTGCVFQFGNNVTSDNGTAIQAYWKSKPFFGDSPFTDKDLRMASWYVAESSGASLTLTYTLNESTSTSKSINLFNSTKNVIQDNWNFPLGSLATNFNAQFGDNSSNPGWEVFGGAVVFVPRPWKVYP